MRIGFCLFIFGGRCTEFVSSLKLTEMTNLIDATRSYEANATAFEASKSMALTALGIGK